MTVTKEELMELIEPKGDIEKVSTISSAGQTLSTRIPKDVVQELGINKGDKISWSLKKGSDNIEIKLEKSNGN